MNDPFFEDRYRSDRDQIPKSILFAIFLFLLTGIGIAVWVHSGR